MAAKGHADVPRVSGGRRRLSICKLVALAALAMLVACTAALYVAWTGGGGGGSGSGSGSGGSSSSSSSSSGGGSHSMKKAGDGGGAGRVLEATGTEGGAHSGPRKGTNTEVGTNSDSVLPGFGRVRLTSSSAGSGLRRVGAMGGAGSGDSRSKEGNGGGDGDVSTAVVRVRKCFQLEAVDNAGHPFDRAGNGSILHRASLACHGMMVGSSSGDGCSSSSSSDGGGSGGGGAGSKGSMIRFTASVQFDVRRGTHMVCFTPPAVGNLFLEVFLVFTNAFQISSSLNRAYGEGYAGSRSVLTITVKVSPSSTAVRLSSSTELSEESSPTLTQDSSNLPFCTIPMIEATRGEGFWEGNQWNPSTCRLHEISRVHAFRCLNGLNVLFLGDSQTRYLFSFLLSLLAFPTREAFLRKYAKNPLLAVSSLNSLKGQAHDRQWQKYQDREDLDDVPRREFKFMGRNHVFCGSLYNGFTRMRVRLWAGPTPVDFNLTYVTYFGIGRPPVRRWMADPTKCDGHVVFEPDSRADHVGGLRKSARRSSTEDSGSDDRWPLLPAQPFDMAVVASQLHDVLHFHSAEGYSRKMREEFERDMRPLVRNGEMHRVVLFGGWAAQEHLKPRHYVYRSNSLRSSEFEVAAEQALLGKEGSGVDRREALDGGEGDGERQRAFVQKPLSHVRVLRMGPMTAPRPDLCIDSTHYSWPVSLAMVDVWLGSVCG